MNEARRSCEMDGSMEMCPQSLPVEGSRKFSGLFKKGLEIREGPAMTIS